MPDIVREAKRRGMEVKNGSRHLKLIRQDGVAQILPYPRRGKDSIRDHAMVGAIVRFLEGK